MEGRRQKTGRNCSGRQQHLNASFERIIVKLTNSGVARRISIVMIHDANSTDVHRRYQVNWPPRLWPVIRASGSVSQPVNGTSSSLTVCSTVLNRRLHQRLVHCNSEERCFCQHIRLDLLALWCLQRKKYRSLSYVTQNYQSNSEFAFRRHCFHYCEFFAYLKSLLNIVVKLMRRQWYRQ